jgi:hypothetical protein
LRSGRRARGCSQYLVHADLLHLLLAEQLG